MKEYTTTYSDEIEGDKDNHERTARFDKTGGYIGITQESDRVLLTPAQVTALISFSKTRSRRTLP